MQKIDWHYSRTPLALQYLESLYQGPLNKITLLDVRRTGKTMFLLNDMHDVALENGFLPIYVNLWQNTDDPTGNIIRELSLVLESGDDDSAIANRRRMHLTKVEVGNRALGKMVFEQDNQQAIEATADQLQTLKVLIEDVIDKYGDKVLLMIDEIQHLATDKRFASLQHALRTILDTNQDISVFFAGSSRAGVAAMFGDKDKPFYASSSMVDMPRLSDDFVHSVTHKLNEHFGLKYDPVDMINFYTSVDKTPFWLMKLAQRAMETRDSLADVILFVNEQIIDDGNFEGIKKATDKLDMLLLESLNKGESSVYTNEFLTMLSEHVNYTVTISKVQSRIKKLTKLKLISVYGKRYYIESPGYLSYMGIMDRN